MSYMIYSLQNFVGAMWVYIPAEKGGVTCLARNRGRSRSPPHRWQGQYLVPHGKKKKEELGEDGAKAMRKGSCDVSTWNPSEQEGQCFGLGDVKKGASGSAEECMKACCGNPKCGAWQWNKELGCFYGGGMHGCQGAADPVLFEPFVGRRKRLQSRKYTDIKHQPWQQTFV